METINPRSVAKFDPRGMNGTIYVEDHYTVYIRAYAEQTVTERTDVYRSTRFYAPKMFFRSFKVTNANIETKLEQMCCIHTRLVVCAQEHNDFSGGSP